MDYINTPEPYKEFPVGLLPVDLASFVKQGSDAIGCSPSFIALPMLSVLGAAIGNTRRLVVKEDWIVPPIIWSAIIGESGTQKSPAFRLATKPVQQLQKAAFDRYRAEQLSFEEADEEYQAAKKAWKRSKVKGEPPVKPKPPVFRRYQISDATVEAVAPILLENPRGVLAEVDELAAWLGSFDKYNKGGSDAAKWLSMYNAGSITIDRKSGELRDRVTIVPAAAVSITGGIQPGIFAKLTGQEHKESGLVARFLLTCPPRRAKGWSDSTISQAVMGRYQEILDYLFGFEFGDEGDKPIFYGISQPAKRLYVEFINQNGQEALAHTGALAAAYSKLEETPARLALILHCSQGREDSIREDTMSSAIQLTEWFKYETARVYCLLSEDPAHKQIRELTEWIRKRGGSVTVRDLQRGPNRYREKAEIAQATLQELVRLKLGEWKQTGPGVKGGPAKREFYLFVDGDRDTSPLSTEETPGSVAMEASRAGTNSIQNSIQSTERKVKVSI